MITDEGAAPPQGDTHARATFEQIETMGEVSLSGDTLTIAHISGWFSHWTREGHLWRRDSAQLMPFTEDGRAYSEAPCTTTPASPSAPEVTPTMTPTPSEIPKAGDTAEPAQASVTPVAGACELVPRAEASLEAHALELHDVAEAFSEITADQAQAFQALLGLVK